MQRKRLGRGKLGQAFCNLVQVGAIPQFQLHAQAHFLGLGVNLVAPAHVPHGQTAGDEADALVIVLAALAGDI